MFAGGPHPDEHALRSLPSVPLEVDRDGGVFTGTLD